MTRRERIEFLLSHYSDVLAGVRDTSGGEGARLPLMCRAFNHASYRELERLVPELRVGAPRGYRAFVGTFVYPRFVRRAVCPKCGNIAPPSLIGELHRHHHGKRARRLRRAHAPRAPLPRARGRRRRAR